MLRDAKRWILYRRISLRYWFFRRPIVTVIFLALIILAVQILLLLALDSQSQVTQTTSSGLFDNNNKVARVGRKSKPKVPRDGLGMILGVGESQQYKYLPTEDGKFKCLNVDVFIEFERLNDDYCDCSDGSDEPSTSACATGTFQCRRGDTAIPSSRVNDGVCDCCDGGDEYLGQIKRLSNDAEVQSFLAEKNSPCPIVC
eukprot:TRINITY_DN27514_c0_g1_i1.p1 TRINITY_DN27514_c0_g1~~TRINITY_DN27514_c0_g1_i1.p1  ORF type:complete len:200 (+),score=20.22 TRINITY_DN27514_c0_g1_i1:75-674(+)